MSEPLLNARFRVEIQGLPATSATEVVLPEVRIGAARSKRARVQYGPLVMRRYMTSSGEWYEW